MFIKCKECRRHPGAAPTVPAGCWKIAPMVHIPALSPRLRFQTFLQPIATVSTDLRWLIRSEVMLLVNVGLLQEHILGRLACRPSSICLYVLGKAFRQVISCRGLCLTVCVTGVQPRLPRWRVFAWGCSMSLQCNQRESFYSL